MVSGRDKMRTSPKTMLSAVPVAIALALGAAPVRAAEIVSLASACDALLTTPDAVACSGYFAGNLLGGSADQIEGQQAAIAALPGDFTFDGNWPALSNEYKIESLSSGNQLSFGSKMFGNTIIGAHFGNVAGPAGNVSVFWLLDFGNSGADYLTLDNTKGFSNAVLYTTGVPGAVPEPSAWALMIFGFGAVGFAIRRRRAEAKQVRVTYA